MIPIEYEVVYLCSQDPEVPCFGKGMCSVNEFGECFHTMHENFAKNGICPDPWNHLDRFDYVTVDDKTYFSERINFSHE